MTKQELMENYTAEQLVGMVINLQGASEVKNDEIHKLKWQISSLEEENGRLKSKIDTYNNYLLPRCTKEAKEMIDHNHFSGVTVVSLEQLENRIKKESNDPDIRGYEETIDGLQSEVEKYRKAFEGAKKERDCQIAEYRKKIEELENHHKFSMMQIDDVLKDFLGVTHEIMDKPHDFEMVLQELIDKEKAELERAKNTINQIDYILEKLFGVRHDTVDKPDEFEKILYERIKGNVTDFLPTEPIKVAEMLITAKGECEPMYIGNDVFKDTYRIFGVSELRQIVEHLLVYCNHNKEEEE